MNQEDRAISAVIPVDLARRPISLLHRLRRLLSDARLQGIHVAIGHNDRGTIFDRALRNMCARHGAQLISNKFYAGVANNALLRNAAMLRVSTPFTLLLDADLYLQADVLRRMLQTVVSGARPFQILPCLYLSRQGSRALAHGRTTPSALLRDYLQFRRAQFLHMAVPSSVVLFRTADFVRAGRFDDQFVGHGYEDLDFLLRLAWLHKEIPKNDALLLDAASRAPLLSVGFRGELARLGLSSLLDGKIAFHLWHSTKKDAYYKARHQNAEIFRRKIAIQVSTSNGKFPDVDVNKIDATLISDWYAMCRARGVDFRNYSILFDNRPGHVDRFDTVIKRLKFLCGFY